MEKKYIDKLSSEEKSCFSLNFLYTQLHPADEKGLDDIEIKKKAFSTRYNNSIHTCFSLYKGISTPLSDLKNLKSTLIYI